MASRFAARRARRVPVPPLSWAALSQIPAPYGPDPYVFGPPYPLDRDGGYAGPQQWCGKHPGVSWRGDVPCFMCEPASEMEKRR